MNKPTQTAGAPQKPLTEESLARGLKIVSALDADLARIYEAHGPPPLWSREPGFPTLVNIILEQQVSLASARAAYERLLASASPLTPERFLAIGDAELRAIGFSRQKSTYVRHLAESIARGDLSLESLSAMDDATARSELLKIKGIGSWTADIYLLMALRRPDAWPGGDLALAIAVEQIKRLPHRPGPSELEAISEGWRPWRAVAARLLWHFYLNRPSTKLNRAGRMKNRAK